MVQTLIRGLRAARRSERSYFKPKPDFYPLLLASGTALGTAVYCSYRAIALNPDVHLTAEHKHDELKETPITLNRAQAYYHSIFRSAWRKRAEDVNNVDCTIKAMPGA
ncbi:hypothetical protein C2E20_9078 [Micractinium conductrix]|uniref:Uncharacterized protein n=1 Tax=Micractinium conductrix TaxID=554055 RepID=A0A2P6UZH2_9CHLO|nr:hypothetical protein C2E20_9078 [Micractinium conductrix]|eukprot:PSC67242.1 hypothetical protein C2E20_9078 [Micractinium conductrix]